MRVTRHVRAVVRALATAPGGTRTGAELMDELELPSGTIYPLLQRLADEGWTESFHGQPSAPYRPVPRPHRLTELGARKAAELDVEG